MPQTEAETRDLAYFLWEQDGRPHGRDHEYWQRALAALAEVAPAEAPQVLPISPLRRTLAVKPAKMVVPAWPKPPTRFRSAATRATAKKR